MLNTTMKKIFSISFMLIVFLASISVVPNDANAFVNDYRNVKKNVKVYQSWSEYRRVSDNMVTGSSGGSISSTKTVTFTPTVQGDISGLKITLGGSKASSIGYILKVGPKKRVYMAYRVRYNIEEGYNYRIDVASGRTVSKKKYVVKKPIYGEYKLINY